MVKKILVAGLIVCAGLFVVSQVMAYTGTYSTNLPPGNKVTPGFVFCSTLTSTPYPGAGHYTFVRRSWDYSETVANNNSTNCFDTGGMTWGGTPSWWSRSPWPLGTYQFYDLEYIPSPYSWVWYDVSYFTIDVPGPTAVADNVIGALGQTVTLDGSGSSRGWAGNGSFPATSIVSYEWKDPDGNVVSTTATASVFVYYGMLDSYTLTVTDNLGKTGSAVVTVTDTLAGLIAILATQEYVNNAIAAIPPVDLSPYALRAELAEYATLDDVLALYEALADYATLADLGVMEGRVEALEVLADVLAGGNQAVQNAADIELILNALKRPGASGISGKGSIYGE